MAFVYLNRYLDVDEAIDEEEGTSTIDHVGFETSDIPQDFIIPERHFLEGILLLQTFLPIIQREGVNSRLILYNHSRKSF